MDDYPDHLSPEFDEGGGVITSFSEWWARVSSAFPFVPEEVARDWLHRHWRHSPYGWLPSAEYRFSIVEWPTERLCEIRTNWNDFAANNAQVVEHGRYLAEDHRKRFGYELADYMIANGAFPVRPVILDNRDRHLDYKDELLYPSSYMLIEGHRRFDLASYLTNLGRMKPMVEFWLMTRYSVQMSKALG